MRRLLNQAANAAARTKASICEIVYRRQVPRMGHNHAIGVIAHWLCRLIWILLHRKVRYEERGPAVTVGSKRQRTARMVRELRFLGITSTHQHLQPGNQAGEDFRAGLCLADESDKFVCHRTRARPSDLKIEFVALDFAGRSQNLLQL